MRGATACCSTSRARTRPFFTRNIVIVTDNAGHTGLGEVPGGEKIRQTLEDARPLVEGQTIGNLQAILNAMRTKFADRDSGGRGLQTFDLRTTIHAVTAVESALLDLHGPAPGACRSRPCWAKASSAMRCRCWGICSLSATARKTDLPYADPASEADNADDWCRLRHEKAMTPEAVVRLAEAAQKRVTASRTSSSRAGSSQVMKRSRP